MTYKEAVNTLESLRSSKKISKAELSRQLDIAPTTYWRVIQHKRVVDAERLIKWAQILGLNIEFIFPCVSK